MMESLRPPPLTQKSMMSCVLTRPAFYLASSCSFFSFYKYI